MSNIAAKTVNQIVLSLNSHLLRETDRMRTLPFDCQQAVFQKLIKCGAESSFGKEHGFAHIASLQDFQQRVPLARYNDMAGYIERLLHGEDYVLWNQKVRWFAKSSGTSSAKSKFIPVTPDSLQFTHFKGMKQMLLNYVYNHRRSKIFVTKALTLGGSVQSSQIEGSTSFCGDLSAVMLSHTPRIVEWIRTPSRKTALAADFAQKVELICQESTRCRVSNFSGVPSWNLVLMNKVLEYTGKNNILEVWPDMELFMHGGINFTPYREEYRKLFPSEAMHYLENYNASEGYFAFQDSLQDPGMLLTLNNGVFYEFVPFGQLEGALAGDNSQVVTLEGVKTGVDYAIVISTVGGLWRYLLEDLVRFTSTAPYKIAVTGRTQMFINAFGEELMIDNAEKALAAACSATGLRVTEYTVAPEFMRLGKKGRHLWAVEFHVATPSGAMSSEGTTAVYQEDIEHFAEVLDKELRNVNSDYDAKRTNDSTMQRLRILPLAQGTFLKWMERSGKLGGQNKVPRLWKDQRFIEELKEVVR